MLAELVTGERAVGFQRLDDDTDSPVLVAPLDAELAESSLHAGQHPVASQAVQPPVVLRTHQVERPPVEPRHHQTTVIESGVYRPGGQPARPAPDGQPEAPPVLGLHGQQMTDDRLGRVARWSGQELGPQSTAPQPIGCIDLVHRGAVPVFRRRR